MRWVRGGGGEEWGKFPLEQLVFLASYYSANLASLRKHETKEMTPQSTRPSTRTELFLPIGRILLFRAVRRANIGTFWVLSTYFKRPGAFEFVFLKRLKRFD